jgi:CheY-like chemotaxis protein
MRERQENDGSSMAGMLLVIDPSPTVQRVVQLVLGGKGFRVAAASDLATARQNTDGPIDVLIIAASAWSEEVGELRSAFGRGGNCPVLMLVERGENRTGASFPHLVKPFTPDRLVAAVETLMAPGDEVVSADNSGPALTKDWTFDPGWLEGGGKPVLWCRLRAFPLPELLQFLRAQRWEAQIRIRSGERRVSVTMRHGRVDFVTAQGVGAGFRLGRFLVSVQAIDRQGLETFISSGAAQGMPLGKALVAAKMISAEQLLAAVRLQTTSLFYELLRWNDGEAAVLVEPEHDDLSRETGLALTVEQLLMEGFRHEDEWNRLQALLPRPNEELEANIFVINGFDLSRLSPLERETLSLLRDGGSLGQLLQRLQVEPIEVCRALHVLIGSRLLRRVSEEST